MGSKVLECEVVGKKSNGVVERTNKYESVRLV